MKKKKPKHFIIYLILGGFLVKLALFLYQRWRGLLPNFKSLVNEEAREVKRLRSGRESFYKFFFHSGSILKDYFIPHQGNDFKPKLLRTRSLSLIVVLLVLIKALASGYLFFIYPNQARMTEAMSREIIELINQDRQQAGLESLFLSQILDQSALNKARDMVKFNYFAHTGLDGKKPWDWISRDDYPYLFVGENLAINFSSAQSAHQALMLSPTHKKNIMNNKYQDIGIAVISGQLKGQNTNILVELFGRRQPLTAPGLVKASQAKTVITAQSAAPEPVTEVLSADSEQPEQNQEAAVVRAEPAGSEASQRLKPAAETATDNKLQVIDYRPAPVLNLATAQEQIKNLSPNSELEHNAMTEVKSFAVAGEDKITLGIRLARASRTIFLFVLALLLVSLLLNILIRIRVQHKPIIIQTLLVIVFLVSLLYLRLHFLEGIITRVGVL